MDNNNNILPLAISMIPVVLYSFLVFILIPNRYVSHRRALRYFSMGMLAPLLVLAFNYAFPSWQIPISSDNVLISIMCFAFFQVGIIEEIAKFLTFWFISTQRKSSVNDLPIATIYYAMMSSAGFAVIENVQYLMHWGDKVLFIRTVSAIPLHLITGLVMGYYIQNGFSKIVMSEKYSFKEKFKMKFHKWRFIISGIGMATIFHGIYDLNLLLPDNTYKGLFLFIILFFGLFIGRFMISEGIRLSKELRDKNYNKDLKYF